MGLGLKPCWPKGAASLTSDGRMVVTCKAVLLSSNRRLGCVINRVLEV